VGGRAVGVIAIRLALPPTLIALPGRFVAVLMGVTPDPR
jgi:hypothetical protein